jgi:hypothetical protein
MIGTVMVSTTSTGETGGTGNSNSTSNNSTLIPLEATSGQKTFKVLVNWTASSGPGKENIFDITFVELESGIAFAPGEITYNISVLKDGKPIGPARTNQTLLQQKYVFTDMGNYKIVLDDIDGTKDSAELAINVTPEFPVGLMLVMTSIFGALLLLARSGRAIFKAGS